jgi:hypothetical protein
MIELNVPEKYLSIIEREAEARSLTVERLFLTSLMDYLPRGAKTKGGRLMPLQVHLPESNRKAVVAAANAVGEKVNFYIARAVGARLGSEKKNGPWLSPKSKRHLAAKVAAEETVEDQPSGVEAPISQTAG